MYTNLDRIRQGIEMLSKFNDSDGEGLTRFSLTDADRGARLYLKTELEKLDLEVYEDAAGSIIGRLEGTDSSAPTILIGSHFDSVRNGGNFDGPAGVIMALEIMRVLKTKSIELKHPIEFVAMIEEEGGRFGAGVFGSRAMTGQVSYEDLVRNKDEAGISMAEAFEAFGFDPKQIGKAARKSEDVKAFIELHIEQGPVLENEKIDVGIVESVVGIREFKVAIKGRPDHAGTTPMKMRIDALCAAAELITELPEYAQQAGEGTVATVGVLNIKPGAANIVPGEVNLTVDIRSGQTIHIQDVYDKIEKKLNALAKLKGIQFEIEMLLSVEPVAMSNELVEIFKKQANQNQFSYKMMTSGAGHDAMIMASLTHSGLIFVPSRDGRSHCKEEWTDYDALQKGIELICHSIIELGR
ncbi:Zn-dependent hydrolase [Fusibacter ferrireducens]|uniref:Zn-dependent hydrolase n=1 Tax=Fusibacter ferrireducens TaxID=2785058 RepID=A0ABR9ZWB4_9FIRM|nr:Zn-dependent hydrolase [Fusibacter ferrireducens]MBF4694185.1 Zn-dependent hydrolase [Fusibacter ferrireducens]